MAKMNVNAFLQKDYENEPPSGPKKTNPNKPNFQKAKMIVNLTLTKDYRKNDDFTVRINKPNFRKAQNERKRICYRGL